MCQMLAKRRARENTIQQMPVLYDTDLYVTSVESRGKAEVLVTRNHAVY